MSDFSIGAQGSIMDNLQATGCVNKEQEDCSS